MTYKEQLKYKLIAEIVDLQSEMFVEALYEVVVNEDYDYVPSLFRSKDDFGDFISKCKSPKSSEGENND